MRAQQMQSHSRAQQSLRSMAVTILGVIGMVLIFAIPANAASSTDEIDSVFQLTNKERDEAGLFSLELDSDLCAAAQTRAEEIAELVSHTRPDGRDCHTILDDYGISYEVWGENIAGGQTSADAVHHAWMNSPSHRENILDAGYSKIGVGYYVVEGMTYWCTLYI